MSSRYSSRRASAKRHMYALMTLISLFAHETAYAQNPPSADPPIASTITLDTAHVATRFEGFGTALVWFANVTGRYAPATRERLADLFYGDDGLRFSIARYNIGGGDAAGTPPYLRPGAAIEGFWKQPSGATGTDW